MKKLFFTILLFVTYTLAFSQSHNYYVSNSGNDSNDGSSINSPFKTINKLNTLVLKAGDNILFKKGDTFRGRLDIKQSGQSNNPITISSYGTGIAPIIAGSTIVTNWKNIGRNIWQATCQQCGDNVTGLYLNTKALPLGRYPDLSAPNSGYLTIKSHVGKTQLTGKESLNNNFKGGEVVARNQEWILDRATIIDQNNNTLTLSGTSYNLNDNWGYFIQNHISTLSKNGEWCYDKTTKTISLYFSNGDPNTNPITVTTYDKGINLINCSNITIKNIQIAECLNSNLYGLNISNLTLNNVVINNAGEDGISIHGDGEHVQMENNQIINTNNNAVIVSGPGNFIFRSNVIKNTALIAGRGKSGDSQYFGLIYASETGNGIIQNNTIDSLGYVGIDLRAYNVTVQNNVISNFDLVKSDGGAIYVVKWDWGNKMTNPYQNIKIYSNFISNGIGAYDGCFKPYPGAVGIYMDDCSQDVDISNNTVFNCSASGIFIHGANHIKVAGNTSFNNGKQIWIVNSTCGDSHDNIVKDNIFFSKTEKQELAEYASLKPNLNTIGTFSNNYYYNAFNKAPGINVGYNLNANSGYHEVPFDDWKSLSGEDAGSKSNLIKAKLYKVTGINGNNMVNAKSAVNWTAASNQNNGSVTSENHASLGSGSLKMSFAAPSGKAFSYLNSSYPIGTVSKGKNYILHFDAMSSVDNKTIQVYLNTDGNPHNDLILKRANVTLNNIKTTYEVNFTATVDATQGRLYFAVKEDANPIWINNVSLQEASETNENPDNYIKFIYNKTSRTKTISLAGSYQDVKGTKYLNKVVLQPFSSVILVKSGN